MKFPQKIGNTWWSFAHWFENLEHGASPGKNWGCWRKPFQTKTSAILKKPLRRLTRFTNKFLCLCSCSGVDGSAVDALDCPRVRFRSLAEATLFAFSYIFYNYFIFFFSSSRDLHTKPLLASLFLTIILHSSGRLSSFLYALSFSLRAVDKDNRGVSMNLPNNVTNHDKSV